MCTCFIIEMCVFGITVLSELRWKHCGDNVNFEEVLLLVSSTLYRTIYRFVSVVRWLHHVAISHGVLTREKSRHTRFRESENLAWKTFRSLSRSTAAQVLWMKIYLQLEFSYQQPIQEIGRDFFPFRREILWNSNSQVQGRIFIKKVFHLQDLPFSSKKCRVEENSRWELSSASAWDKCGKLKCNKNSSAVQFIIPQR